MKINANTRIWTDRLVLVPYRRRHVPRYHGWMQSAELRRLTASEPLSLQQEYDMQRAWRHDDDKCTFILLDRGRFEATGCEEAAMIGDVNLFLTGGGDADGDGDGDGGGTGAEVEAMVAEPWARGAGRGRQATAAMLRFGVETLRLARFQAKIGLDNEASRAMFATLGFAEVSRSEVFGEVTLEAVVDADWRRRVQDHSRGYRVEVVPHDDDDQACL